MLFRLPRPALSIVLLLAVGLGRAADLRADADRGPPSWMDQAVIYGVAPPLFGPLGFEAVIDRLDAIAALGVNTLWLSPVTDAPDGDFGYALTDPFAVRPSLGGEAGLRALITAAHRHGLRVILDVVVNHFADRHPYARDVGEYGHQSPYYDFSRMGPTADSSIISTGEI